MALIGTGSGDLALEVLERGLRERPHDRDLLTGVATMLRDAGRIDEALRYARQLASDWPGDPIAPSLVEELEASAGR